MKLDIDRLVFVREKFPVKGDCTAPKTLRITRSVKIAELPAEGGRSAFSFTGPVLRFSPGICTNSSQHDIDSAIVQEGRYWMALRLDAEGKDFTDKDITDAVLAAVFSGIRLIRRDASVTFEEEMTPYLLKKLDETIPNLAIRGGKLYEADIIPAYMVEARKKPKLTIVPSSVTKTVGPSDLLLFPDERDTALASCHALGAASENIAEIIPLTELEIPYRVRLNHFYHKLNGLLEVIKDEGFDKSWRQLRGKEFINAYDELRTYKPNERALKFAPDHIERMIVAATNFVEAARHRLDIDDKDPFARVLGGLEAQLSSLKRSNGHETPSFLP